MKSVNGLVKPLNTNLDVNYENHTLFVSYNLIGSQNSFLTTYQRLTVPLPKNGDFLFEIPDSTEIVGKIRISIKGPINEIYSEEYDYADLAATTITPTKTKNTSVPIEIVVDPQYQIIVPSDHNVVPYKVRGRLINFADGSAIAQKTVFIYLHYMQEDEHLTLQHLGVYTTIKTDAAGYFTINLGGEPLRNGYLKIAGLNEESFTLRMSLTNPEQLEKNQIVVVDGSLIEEHEADEDDCGCHATVQGNQMPDAEDLVLSGAYSNMKGKNCVDFTTPNRSLEEFSFVKIVRTTEPDIKKIPYRKPPLLKLPNGSNFNHIQAIAEISLDPEEGTGMSKTMNPDQVPKDPQVETKEKDLRGLYLYIQNSWAANRKWWVFEDRPFELIDTASMMFTPKPESYDLYDPVEQWKKTLEELFVYLYEKAHKTEVELYNFLKFITAEFQRENQRKCANPDEMEDFVKNFFQKGSHGRIDVDSGHRIDWDDSPTLYQNTSIAHGHILHIKQIWRADGYSMGDLLYSLPLAPCQKKQIAIFDWGRSETSGRSESLTAEEHLTSHLSRDRDVTDIINTSLSEQMKGGSESQLYSKSKTAGIGGGFGGAGSASASISLPPEAMTAATGVPANVNGSASLGVSGGIAGGYGVQTNNSNSSASAWQNSARNLSASSMNSLKDSIMQSASAVRSQRSTVIETISQSETMSVQTEVIANHNHCHSMTMEYFEVLRHFAIEQKVADVQECLFIPLEMSAFTAPKILRWKDEIYRALPAQGLRDGILALEDIQRKYQFANPNEILADEPIQEIFGQIILSVNVNRPADDPLANEAEFQAFQANNWGGLAPFLGNWNLSKIRSAFEKAQQKERDEIWTKEILPEIITNFLDLLEIDGYDNQGNDLNLHLEMSVEPNTRVKYSRLNGKAALKKSAKIDMLRGYKAGNELKILLRLFPHENAVSRKQISSIQIKNNFTLPAGSKVVFFGGFMRYTTNSLNETLFSLSERHKELDQNNLSIPTPLNNRELFNPLKEAYRVANRLIEHINDHLEHYHKVIWYQMDKDKRYMMLDGFTAPNAGGRSVASVIENKLIDIVGNNLVMPVASGVRIDPTFKQPIEGEGENAVEKPIDLLKHYSPNTPIPPFRISVPTRGVYAEAVMGNCNSCEKIDESRHWRFTEVPCGDEPTAIQAISTDSRRSTPSDLTAKDFATPIVNIQNAPNAPDPQGFAGALSALTASNAFNNLTGLDQTQLNALEALKAASAGSSAAMQSSMDSAQAYAQMAKDLAMHASSIKNSDKTAEVIDKAQKDGKISDEDAKLFHAENIKSRIPSLMKDSADLPQRDPNSLLNSDEMKKALGNASKIEYNDPDEGSISLELPHGGVGLSADGQLPTDVLEDLLVEISPRHPGDNNLNPGGFNYINGGSMDYTELFAMIPRSNERPYSVEFLKEQNKVADTDMGVIKTTIYLYPGPGLHPGDPDNVRRMERFRECFIKDIYNVWHCKTFNGQLDPLTRGESQSKWDELISYFDGKPITTYLDSYWTQQITAEEDAPYRQCNAPNKVDSLADNSVSTDFNVLILDINDINKFKRGGLGYKDKRYSYGIPSILGKDEVMLVVHFDRTNPARRQQRSFITNNGRNGAMNFEDVVDVGGNVNTLSFRCSDTHVAAHEFGHILGLSDRYTYFAQYNDTNMKLPPGGRATGIAIDDPQMLNANDQLGVDNQYYTGDGSGGINTAGAPVDNLMANALYERITDYQFKAVFNYYLEPSYPQFTFYYDQPLAVQHSESATIPQTLTLIGGATINTTDIDLGLYQPVQGPLSEAELQRRETGQFSFAELQIQIRAAVTSSILQPNDLFVIVDQYANEGDDGGTITGRTLWNTTDVQNVVVDGINYNINLFVNRRRMYQIHQP